MTVQDKWQPKTDSSRSYSRLGEEDLILRLSNIEQMAYKELNQHNKFWDKLGKTGTCGDENFQEASNNKLHSSKRKSKTLFEWVIQWKRWFQSPPFSYNVAMEPVKLPLCANVFWLCYLALTLTFNEWNHVISIGCVMKEGVSWSSKWRFCSRAEICLHAKTTIIETRSWHLMESRMKEYLMKGIVYEQFYSPHHNCSAGVYQCSVDRWKGNTVGIVSRPLSHMNTMRWNVLCAFAIRHKNETNGHLLELTRVVKHMNEIGAEMIKWEFGSICLL